MNKLIKFFIISLLGILVLACQEKFDIEQIPTSVVPSLKEYYLTINNKEFNFSSQGGNLNASVSASGVWNFIGIPAWLGINPAQGSGGGTAAVTLTAAANTSTEERALAFFELQSPANEDGWYANHTLTASQTGAIPFIKILESNGNESGTDTRFYDGKTNSEDFYIERNCNYEITCSDSWITYSDPITISETRDKVTIHLSDNTTDNNRVGSVNIHYVGSSETKPSVQIPITQYKANISANADIQSYTYIGGTGIIQFESEARWEASTNASFIELIADGTTTTDNIKGESLTGVAGNGTFGFNVNRNSSQYSRNGTITITIDGTNFINIPIEQGNVTLEVPDVYLNLGFGESMPETQNIRVTSNAPYTLTSEADWIEFTNKNDGNPSITAKDNPSMESRSTDVYITSDEDGTLFKKLSLTQSGKTFELSSPSGENLNFSKAGSTQNIMIYTNAVWSASTTSNWLTIENTGGTPTRAGYINIPVKVSENKNAQYRSGTVQIKMKDNPYPINVGVYQDPAEFEVGTSSLHFNNHTDSTTIYISSNSPWSISTDQNWISVSPSEGTPASTEATMQSFAITISVTENTSLSERSGIVYVNMYGEQKTISITQSSAYFDISTYPITLGNAPDTTTVSFRTNGKWSAKSDSDWIKLTPSSGNPTSNEISELKVSVTANNSSNQRKGKITISVYEASTDIEIIQEGAYISVGVDSLVFNNKNSSQTIDFTINGVWSATSDSNWITLSPENGSGTGYSPSSIKVSVTDNPSTANRVGKVSISMYDSVKVVKVIQTGAYLSMERDSISVGHYAQTYTHTFRTNGIWSAASNSDWITVSPISGASNSYDESEVYITVTSNNNTTPRDGKITITMYDKKQIIKVHQSASSISLSPELIKFSHGNSRTEFYISTNTGWNIEVEPSGSWLSVDRTSGGENSTGTIGDYVGVSATPNDENKERTGKIIITTKSEVKVITVKQEQKYLEISSPALDFPASGGDCSITITKTTDDIKAYSNADWVKVENRYNSYVSIQVGTNDSKHDRSAIVTIENDYNKSYKLNLTQKGRNIIVSNSGVSLFAKSGTTVTTATVDGEFTVSTEAGSWLTATHKEGTDQITVTAVENETGAERTDYVTVSLAGQPTGEEPFSKKIAVKQYPYTNKISLEGFDGADKGITVTTGKEFSIKITTYTSDKNYNKQDGEIDTTVNGYGDDKGKDKNGNGNITINGYGDDKNYNN